MVNVWIYTEACRFRKLKYFGNHAIIYSSRVSEERLAHIDVWAEQWQYEGGESANGSYIVGTLVE